MPTEFLTALKVKSIKEPGAYLDGRGLRLIVTSTGTKRWELWIKVNGRRREFGLGLYPDVTLHDARTKADEIRRTARDGGDVATKASASSIRPDIPTGLGQRPCPTRSLDDCGPFGSRGGRRIVIGSESVLAIL